MYGDGLIHRPKMWCSCRENKLAVISYFIFHHSSTICIFNFYHSFFHPPYFYLLLFHIMFLFPIIACHKIKNFKKINKRNFGKEWREVAFFLMILVSGLSMRRTRWGGWRKLGESGGQGLAGQPPTPSFPTFFSTNILFSSTTTTLVHNGATLAIWAGRSAT
jgi:hypothetical protein